MLLIPKASILSEQTAVLFSMEPVLGWGGGGGGGMRCVEDLDLSLYFSYLY